MARQMTPNVPQSRVWLEGEEERGKGRVRLGVREREEGHDLSEWRKGSQGRGKEGADLSLAGKSSGHEGPTRASVCSGFSWDQSQFLLTASRGLTCLKPPSFIPAGMGVLPVLGPGYMETKQGSTLRRTEIP